MGVGMDMVRVGVLEDFVPAPGHDERGILMLEVQPAAAPVQSHSGGALASCVTPAAGYPACDEPGMVSVSEWTGEPVLVYKTRAGELFAIQVRLGRDLLRTLARVRWPRAVHKTRRGEEERERARERAGEGE